MIKRPKFAAYKHAPGLFKVETPEFVILDRMESMDRAEEFAYFLNSLPRESYPQWLEIAVNPLRFGNASESDKQTQHLSLASCGAPGSILDPIMPRRATALSLLMTSQASAKLSERKTVHEWLTLSGIPCEENGRRICLLRRLSIALKINDPSLTWDDQIEADAKSGALDSLHAHLTASESGPLMPLEDACMECGADTSGGEGYDGLCGTCADRAAIDPLEREANAQLIAAAPDLLELLQTILLRLDMEPVEPVESVFPCSAMRNDIRSAIAKATLAQ